MELAVKWHILGRRESREGKGQAREGTRGRLAPSLILRRETVWVGLRSGRRRTTADPEEPEATEERGARRELRNHTDAGVDPNPPSSSHTEGCVKRLSGQLLSTAEPREETGHGRWHAPPPSSSQPPLCRPHRSWTLPQGVSRARRRRLPQRQGSKSRAQASGSCVGVQLPSPGPATSPSF